MLGIAETRDAQISGGRHAKNDQECIFRLTCDTRNEFISDKPVGRTERTVNVSFAAATAVERIGDNATDEYGCGDRFLSDATTGDCS